jgi:hypothetical protein
LVVGCCVATGTALWAHPPIAIEKTIAQSRSQLRACVLGFDLEGIGGILPALGSTSSAARATWWLWRARFRERLDGALEQRFANMVSEA